MDLTPALIRAREMIYGLIASLPNLILALLLFILFYIAGILVRSAVRRTTEKREHIRGAGIAIGRLAQGAVLFVGILITLAVALPSIKPADVVQVMGIGSVAIGFAFRDIFQNFLAGILLLLTHPFRIGDQIIVGELEGTVEDIQTRATFIKTYDGRRIVMPNAELFTREVTVNTAFPIRRVEYDLSIGYEDDLEVAKRLILESIAASENALKEPKPDVLLVELADFGVKIRARWWVKPPLRSELLESRDRILTLIKDKFKLNGIELPFPTYIVQLRESREEQTANALEQPNPDAPS